MESLELVGFTQSRKILQMTAPICLFLLVCNAILERNHTELEN